MTTTVYDLVVVVSEPFTTTVMVLSPTSRAMSPLGLPLATSVPLTVSDAAGSDSVAVTVVVVTALATESV